MMVNVAAFSGGKDSTALVLWLRQQGIPFTPVFCDTGWEHPLTYAHIAYINRDVLGGQLQVLRSERYAGGFLELTTHRRTFPSAHQRFCTQELKIFPLHAFIEAQDDDVTVYQGIRADESARRRKMTARQWVDDAGGYWIDRPLFTWTAAEVFELHAAHGVEPNPLYKLGAKRVGCYPCVMVSHRELRQIAQLHPDVRERVIALERDVNAAVQASRPGLGYRGFFRADYIPERFCSMPYLTEDGRAMRVPTAADVFDYVGTHGQLDLFDDPEADGPRCLSFYNLCE